MRRGVWAAVVFSIFLAVSCTPQETVFYVSPRGNDTWTGRLKTPNASKTDGPLASPEGIRKALKRLKSGGAVTVYFCSGNYRFTKPLALTGSDLPRTLRSLKFQALPGDTVRFWGARKIANFAPVQNEAIAKRFPRKIREKIVVTDLKSTGITDLGEITRRGSPPVLLFCKGRQMPIARFPNDGWLRIADVPQTGDTLFRKGLEREKRYNGVPVGRHYGRIAYSGNRPNGWSDDNEIYMHGYWTWDWSDSYQRVRLINRRKREITIAPPHHHYGYTKNQRYYFLNILEELDRPGEWCLIRKTGKLYFYPPDPEAVSETFISAFRKPFFILKNTENVAITAIHFELSAGEGVHILGGRNNVISNCTFTNLGGQAVTIKGGFENGVQNCEFADLGMGAIYLDSGSRKTLTSGKSFVVNNHIHHYSQWIRAGQYGVKLYGVGNRVAFNLIHDAPHEGIYLSGNDHVIEYNEFHHLCQETGDAGAIHTGRDYTWRGNVIRYNYFHHLKGPGLHGVVATYLDDFASGFRVYGNIYYKTTRGVLIGGGRDNVVENNIFVDCHPSIVLDARGLGWASNYFDGTITTLWDRLKQVHAFEPPYIEKYPELKRLNEGNPAVPANNKILRNISCGGFWMDLFDFYAYDFRKVTTIGDNIIGDSLICKHSNEKPKGWDPYYLNIDFARGYKFCGQNDPEAKKLFAGNWIISDKDSAFAGLKRGDFHIKRGSILFSRGFKSIPIEKIGLKKRKFVEELNF